MKKVAFNDNDTILPVTPKQFEDLTNDILKEFNNLITPTHFDAEVMASIIMSSIHSLPKNKAYIKKSDLFEMCVCRVSMKMTYDIIDAIHKGKNTGENLLEDGEISPIQIDEKAQPALDADAPTANEQPL